MGSLNQLLNDIKAAKKDAELDLSLYPMKVLASKSIAKADGQKRMESLTKEFNREVASRAVSIILLGDEPAQKRYTAIASVKGPALVVSATEAYEKMAADVEPTIGRERMFAGTQLNHLIRSVEEVARKSGSTFVQPPTLKDVFIAKTREELVNGIRDLVLPQVGPSLNRNYIQAMACEQALNTGFNEPVVPIVVTGASKDEIDYLEENLFEGVGVTITLPKDAEKVDENYVLESFRAVKEARKQKRVNQHQQ